MRFQALKQLRMPGGKGVVHQPGDEFDLPEDKRGKDLGNIFIAAKLARKFEPVAIGTPPPLPTQKVVALPEPPPESTPEPSLESPPEPTPEPAPSLLQKVMRADEGAPAEADEATVENGEEPEGDAPRRRGRPPIHGRYSRRDIRPEE